MTPLAIYSPHALQSNEPPALSDFGYRFLAEGDSWFTIGSLNPAKNSNLLFELQFSQSACAINCAYPGDRLQKMVNMNSDPMFVRQLKGRTSRHWDGLLLSAGGNDLIAALEWQGPEVQAKDRLLLKSDEWPAGEPSPDRYISPQGWERFAAYIKENLMLMLDLRDSGASRGAPIFMHSYALPTPRPAGAGMGHGPWLLPSLQAYAIPAADHAALAEVLMTRLAALLVACSADSTAFPNLHVFDSTSVPVVQAAPGTTGSDGDWVNEIHLTWRGYEKIAQPWAAEIERIIAERRSSP